jgi:hypothetical protein
MAPAKRSLSIYGMPDAFRLGSYRLEGGSATESAAAFVTRTTYDFSVAMCLRRTLS